MQADTDEDLAVQAYHIYVADAQSLCFAGEQTTLGSIFDLLCSGQSGDVAKAGQEAAHRPSGYCHRSYYRPPQFVANLSSDFLRLQQHIPEAAGGGACARFDVTAAALEKYCGAGRVGGLHPVAAVADIIGAELQAAHRGRMAGIPEHDQSHLIFG